MFKKIFRLNFDLNKLNDICETDKFDGYNVYRNSKLAELMFAKELSQRLKGIYKSQITKKIH